MKEITTSHDAVRNIFDGASIMIGGFMCCGQPLGLIDAILATGCKELTVICNDAGTPGVGVAKLIAEGRVRHLVASHIGLNPQAGEKMHKGEMKVDLVPQGTLAERIRCAGTGLGGVLTPTGLGTNVEIGKPRVMVDGQEFLLETALSADFSFIYADVCDEFGNSFVAKAAKNFNIVMAMAAKHTIVETKKLVKIGELDADAVSIPGIFVQSIVKG